MRRFLPASLILFCLIAAGCGPALPSGLGGGKLRVVATVSIIGDLVRNVSGDEIELTVLVGPGQDSHTFEPIPANARALADASLVFENGLGLETWLDDLYASAGSTARRVVVTDGLELRAAADERQSAAGHAAPRMGPRGAAPDPHVWHSAANAVGMVRNIRQALLEADPAHAAAYAANAEAYLAELHELDTWIFAQVQTIPVERRKLVTTHDSLGYFAERYGFEVLGTLLPTSTEGASPSARDMAALVEAMRAAGVPAVFADNVASNSLLNQVANEAGVKVVATLYTDALGPAGSDGDTYVKMMRANVGQIVNALRP